MNAPRLSTLSTYLRALPREKFAFNTFIEDIELAPGPHGKEIPCGAVGCALGHCPLAFPGQWGWICSSRAQTGFYPSLNRPLLRPSMDPFADAVAFFNLTMGECHSLFFQPDCPFADDPECFVYGQIPGPNVTPSDVADAIDLYLLYGKPTPITQKMDLPIHQAPLKGPMVIRHLPPRKTPSLPPIPCSSCDPKTQQEEPALV